MIKQTTASNKVRRMQKRIRVLQGGQGASKTFTVLLRIIDQCIVRENTSVSIFQYELTKMKRTVIRDFIRIMKETDNWVKSEWNASSSTYNFRNGSYIEFVGLSDAEIGKGFRRDIVYFNEANKGILFESYQQVASRAKIIYIDFNPDREFWVHTEVLPDKNSEYLCLTFYDNESLPETERQSILDYQKKGFVNPNLEVYDFKANIKSEYWANKWRVYGLGQTGTLEGQIYKWKVISEIAQEAELISYGLDFGFNDPTVLVELYKYGFGYILNERLYKEKLDSEDLKREILALNLNKKITIRADGSRPELIKMLKNTGLLIEGVDKREKNDRILLLSAEDISVTRSSTNVIREQSNYVWKKSNDGTNKDVPIETNDHTMDASLYSADKVVIRIKNKSTSWGSSRTV
jgi:phage terminase large subunit